MSENQSNKQAFQEAEKELLDEKKEEVKGLIMATLRRIESKKQEKERVDEELRILKLDLEDLRNGNFDKIKERQDKSKVANSVSVAIAPLLRDWPFQATVNNWLQLTGGTYTTEHRVYYF
jgi:hypothetical protein